MGRRQSLILRIVSTDKTFERRLVGAKSVWCGKCIHCNSKLVVTAEGDAAYATVEHIVPTTKGGDEALDNLALACRRCNNLKGKRLDQRPLSDPALQHVIALLRARRQARWRDPPG
ncbi:MAG: HNH endonuclease [Deltaproteobacteria bacterium]|nr:MAG: HNH endonuclease [Deltaproteobacteria bacterium]